MKNKYTVTYIKELCILAKDEEEAQKIAIERCANDSELLMPHNMEERIEKSDYPDSYFD